MTDSGVAPDSYFLWLLQLTPGLDKKTGGGSSRRSNRHPMTIRGQTFNLATDFVNAPNE
jgi:hypothetical protein